MRKLLPPFGVTCWMLAGLAATAGATPAPAPVAEALRDTLPKQAPPATDDAGDPGIDDGADDETKVRPTPVAPFDADDRKALAAVAETLPLHGVVPASIPALDAPDDAWAVLAETLVTAFAPARAGAWKRNHLIRKRRPLTPELQKWVPTHHRYLSLQQILVELANGGGPNQPVIRRPPYDVRVGKTAPEVGQLRDRLLLEGYGDSGVRGRLRDYFDPRLKRALWKWQRDNGLPRTITLDHLTRKRLNRKLGALVPHVALALRRWRDVGLIDDVGRHVLVHVNDFELTAENEGKVELRLPVIVGSETAENETPAIHAPVEAIVVNPEWRLPKRIAASLKAKVKGVEQAAIDLGYEIIVEADNSWRVKKPPGSTNPLGRVKFMLRGTKGVYLHDTSNKKLFKETRRTFSHGCVRVSEPVDLARWMLFDQPVELDAAFDGNETVKLRTTERLNTYLVYQTLSLDGKGGFLRHPDIYKRDKAALATIDRVALLAALKVDPTANDTLD